jgi:anaerobic magnesium-protoporphyrin IX monomethyl ester cyclase
MRFLLINPFYPISETPSPPLGLAYLAAALEKAGVAVEILDLVVHPYSDKMMASCLARFKPHFVGTTSVTMTFDNAMQVIKDVKKINPEILTVMGGPHATFCAQETLEQHPELDLIVIGEGEDTVVELAQSTAGDIDWSGIQGIAYRDGSKVITTQPREPIQDLDTLAAPARHLLPLGRYRALRMPISMTTSRGCPFKCIFCVGRKMVGAKVRYRNADNVVDELEYLKQLGFHQINIADDLFTSNKKHCLAVCDEILRRKLQVNWTSFARVDTVSLDVLIQMKAAGCSGVSFGIETGNPEIMKTIKKGITLEQVTKAVELCNQAGVSPFASFILGLPGETPETIKETMAFGKKLKDMGLAFGFHLLAPFPGTDVRTNSDAYGIKILTDDWSQYHANRAIVETPSVNRKMLDDIVIEWENEYNLFLANVKEDMQHGQAAPEDAAQLVNLERIVLIYELMMKHPIDEIGALQQHEHSAGKTEMLQNIAERISKVIDGEPDRIKQTLQSAIESRSLEWRNTEGNVRLEWVDYLT